jgi:hypothetical protein
MMENVNEENTVEVKAFPFVVSKHKYPGNYEGEGSESGEGEAGEGGSEGGTNG